MNGFNVDHETLRRSIRAHHGFAETMSQAHGAGQVTVGIEGPIDEPATMAYIEAAAAVGEKHQRSIEALHRKLSTRIDELGASDRQYGTTDEGVAEDFGRGLRG